MIRGQQGEAAIIQLNGREANMNSAIQANDNIVITESTKGVDASYEIGNLPEYTSVIQFMLNGKRIDCPKMATVNGELVPSGYAIQSGDNIEILNYYTLEQVLAFMDLPYYPGIMVNNENAGPEEKVFDNFKVEYRIQEQVHVEPEVHVEAVDVTKQIAVRVNEKSIQLQGKESYILVDILDYYPFDTTIAGGKRLVMEINQESAEFTSAIIDGDVISLYWEN